MNQKKTIVSVANLQKESLICDDTDVDVDVDLTDTKINCSYFRLVFVLKKYWNNADRFL